MDYSRPYFPKPAYIMIRPKRPGRFFVQDLYQLPSKLKIMKLERLPICCNKSHPLKINLFTVQNDQGQR